MASKRRGARKASESKPGRKQARGKGKTPKPDELARKRTLAGKKAAATRKANQEFARRSAAAKKGWRTRKALKPPIPGRPPKRNVWHLVTLKFQTREKRGEPLRTYKRDLLIPAPPGTSFKKLKAIAAEYLPPEAQKLLRFMTRKNTTIAPGPKTRARKAVDR